MADKTKAQLEQEIAELQERVKYAEEQYLNSNAELDEKTVVSGPMNDREIEQARISKAHLEERVSIRLIKDSHRYQDDVHVGVNGTNYVIQRGVTVMVPRAVAHIIENAYEQEIVAIETSERLSKNFEAQMRAKGL